jgi:hypothetical protein
MTVDSDHVISIDDYLILKMTYELALSKIEYNCGKGQNPFPSKDSLPPICHPVSPRKSLSPREQELSGSQKCACAAVQRGAFC